MQFFARLRSFLGFPAGSKPADPDDCGRIHREAPRIPGNPEAGNGDPADRPPEQQGRLGPRRSWEPDKDEAGASHGEANWFPTLAVAWKREQSSEDGMFWLGRAYNLAEKAATGSDSISTLAERLIPEKLLESARLGGTTEASRAAIQWMNCLPGVQPATLNPASNKALTAQAQTSHAFCRMLLPDPIEFMERFGWIARELAADRNSGPLPSLTFDQLGELAASLRLRRIRDAELFYQNSAPKRGPRTVKRPAAAGL